MSSKLRKRIMGGLHTGLDWIAPRLIYLIASAAASTVRLETDGEERIEAARARYGGVILATWHGRTLIPITHYRGRGYWALVSTSRDGDYQWQILGWFGWNRVRGSTSSRGAVAAALKMARELRRGAILAHTPDGPRGPSHLVQPGAIFLAERSGCPIIPAGVTITPALQLRSWDRYMLPKLFARALIVYGEPMLVPPDIDQATRDRLCVELGREITRLEEEAETRIHTPSRERCDTAPAGTRST